MIDLKAERIAAAQTALAAAEHFVDKIKVHLAGAAESVKVAKAELAAANAWDGAPAAEPGESVTAQAGVAAGVGEVLPA